MGERVLRYGERGHDVRVLQDFLTRAGFRTTITGYFGPGTKKDLTKFQKSQRFKPDGILWIPVEKRLRKVVAAREMPSGSLRINSDGTGTAPRNSPNSVLKMVAAANRIHTTSYCYAGGHGSWNDSCYDCSGAVSYVLHAAGMLSYPEDSTELESFGSPGKGKWVTIYANANHTWIVIAGRAFDTADFGGPDTPGGSGPRWRSDPTGNLQDGQSYVVRHPNGL
jgi:peptidoglycan hydrolase-like protein with peptidoglycan-binding domain